MSDSGHIIVVDDHQGVCDALRDYLSDEGYRVSTANTADELRGLLARTPADLVILDLLLPDQDGLSLARELRSKSNIGIIMLTGRGEPVDRIIGLEMGADDYLTKPPVMRELLARVKSVLRRASSRVADNGAAPRPLATFAGWLLDLSARSLSHQDGREVNLTTGEFELLAAFVSAPNQVLSRDRLSERTRRREVDPFDRTIDVQVGRLRRKLEDDPKHPTLIKTVRGGGYILVAPVELR